MSSSQSFDILSNSLDHLQSIEFMGISSIDYYRELQGFVIWNFETGFYDWDRN